MNEWSNEALSSINNWSVSAGTNGLYYSIPLRVADLKNPQFSIFRLWYIILCFPGCSHGNNRYISHHQIHKCGGSWWHLKISFPASSLLLLYLLCNFFYATSNVIRPIYRVSGGTGILLRRWLVITAAAISLTPNFSRRFVGLSRTGVLGNVTRTVGEGLLHSNVFTLLFKRLIIKSAWCE
jgi:hypothetical protein